MRRADGLSKFLAGVLIPLCIWGLTSSLLLHLIELRSVFIAGGETKLRIATLAFAGGTVLVQRLSALQGRSLAMAYAWTLGLAISAFLLHEAIVHRLPVHPIVVFAVNEALFMLLMWAVLRITASCSVDDGKQLAAAAESGILPRLGFGGRAPVTQIKETEIAPADEAKWTERLARAHPGRVILYFSLVAIPAFGTGAYFFDPEKDSALRLGGLLFLYLWCAFALLFLSSLRQLTAYFEQRDVSLPEGIGLTWLAIGFAIVTGVMLLAFLLPQPPSVSNFFVRDRILTAYRGWEAASGIRDTQGNIARSNPAASDTKTPAPSNDPRSSAEAEVMIKDSHSNVDAVGDSYLSEMDRHGIAGTKAVHENYLRMKGKANENFRRLFDGLLRFLMILGAIAGVVVAYVVVMSFYRGLSERVALLRWRRIRGDENKKPKKKKSRRGEQELPARFREFTNPFAAASGKLDGNAVVRYLWSATAALCADCGSPCGPEMTPREFLASRPAGLQGFEDQAEYIARLFSFSEFSGEPVPETELPSLRKFWEDLQAHARRVPA